VNEVLIRIDHVCGEKLFEASLKMFSKVCTLALTNTFEQFLLKYMVSINSKKLPGSARLEKFENHWRRGSKMIKIIGVW